MKFINWIKEIGSNTLYYPGCLTKAALPKELENYKEIFNILDIDFIMLPDKEFCCGSPVLNAGYKKDARKLAQENYEVFKKYSIKKIITNCPACYNTFKIEYPKLLRKWDIEVEHATVSILNALRKKNIIVQGKDEPVTYHDPCHLGRYSGIYDEPRRVIELLGGKIIEMKHNKENSLCCGGGGGMRANYPDVSQEIAKKRLSEMPSEATSIVTPCGLCYSNLKINDKAEEFSSFVLRKLK